MQAMHGPVYRSRLRALTAAIQRHLRAGDRVLDVGCGFGHLGRSLLEAPGTPAGVTVRGLESAVRDGARIEIDAYDGRTMPHADNSFDIVILADVLHHEHDPDRLIAECKRVSRRLLIIKDHKREGLLAQPRIALIDWAANAPYGVPCLYRYLTWGEWNDCLARHGLKPVDQQRAMDLYPPVYNLLFGRRLQYFVAAAVDG